ncbi:MAG: hypothetical protein PHY24_08670 [Candidatus Cloacimonetes bacterium]|nr:hypothetical protein [Candidatus Cloacimonadota bacterium]MCK9242698.1 hypothetical protein [Candidatus Cloacimonadota bacterium]MDD3104270.1 hypothetical protein [Candidatus Cloacimonadota bacterium]MDD3533363.1 hypothetical protein [Candidatus Cloacimonadota bacterium]
MLIEKNLRQLNQYLPAYANEPLFEKHPLSYLQSRKQLHAFHNTLFSGIIQSKINHYIPISPCMGGIHLTVQITLLTVKPAIMSLCMTAKIASKIKQAVEMSKTLALCLYVLASQSSHDYTQNAYGLHRHSFAFELRVSKQKPGALRRGNAYRQAGLLS